MWQTIDKSREGSAHYAVMKEAFGIDSMDALEEMFPDAKADAMNFVLFSTSGVHGTYNTIEEAESFINGADDGGGFAEVTYLVIHPRLVALRYGNCNPRNMQDIEFLKALRKSSHNVVAKIGFAE